MTEQVRRFTGKVALVTGAGRGIGAAIARRLASEGADLTLTWGSSEEPAKQVAEECRGHGVRVELIQADAASREAMTGLVGEVVERLGKLDILVSNAGILMVKPIDETSDEDYDRMFDINVRAAFLLVRAAAKVMKEGGRIITIGSVSARRSQAAGGHLYCATKAALASLTKCWSRDLGPRGITCNVIQPGPTNTEMNPADGPFADYCRSLTALGRYGEASEIAALVAFVASPEANYITGAAIDIDGGVEA